jgi:hypothetical protein
MIRAKVPRTEVNFRNVFLIVNVPFWRKVRRYERDISFTYFRIHLLAHTSGNCDGRLIFIAACSRGVVDGSKEMPVTRPIRNEATMAANFTGGLCRMPRFHLFIYAKRVEKGSLWVR